MPDTAKPYVWLQAASDAEMALHATVIGIYTTSKGGSATHPLIIVNNGWTFHHGTKVTLGNVGGSATLNNVLRGNTFLMSDTPASGTISYFGTGVNIGHPNSDDQTPSTGNLAYRMPIDDDSGNFAFYITDLDGTALASAVDETDDVQGVASVYLDDADPRKVYGLPYFFISHDIGSGTDGDKATVIHAHNLEIGLGRTDLPPVRPHQTNLTEDEIYPHHAYTLSSQLIPWPIMRGSNTSYSDLVTGAGDDGKMHPLQVGRNLNLTSNIKGSFMNGDKYQTQETLNVRTKWDWIAEHTASATPKTADQSSGVSVPGYAYGDSTVNYRRVISDVWRVGEGSGTSTITANDYGAEIFTDSPSHLVAGQLFTVTNMKDTVLVDLDVRYKVDAATSPAVTGDIPNNLYFMVKEMVGQFCIRTEAVKDTIVTDPVLGAVWVSQFVVNNSVVVTTHPGQIAYDNDHDSSGDDNYSDIARAGVVAKGYAAHPDEIMNTPGRIPTTTRFQLHVEAINHKYSDQVAVTPMVKSAGTKSSIFEQLQILGLNIGMRAESIDLSGTLRDTGPVRVDNIRKQVLLNIARTQWLKIMGFWGGKNGPQLHGSHTDFDTMGDFDVLQFEAEGYLHTQAKSDEYQSKGKGFGGPINPRSYACLTIFNPKEQSSDDGKKVDLNTDGGYNIYRGVIKNLSFTQQAGRPDIWTWRMTFEVISNEKLATTLYNSADD